MNSLSVTVLCGACRCKTHIAHEILFLFLERAISIKQEFSPLPSHSFARARLNLDLRSRSGDQDTLNMLFSYREGVKRREREKERFMENKNSLERTLRRSVCER